MNIKSKIIFAVILAVAICPIIYIFTRSCSDKQAFNPSLEQMDDVKDPHRLGSCIYVDANYVYHTRLHCKNIYNKNGDHYVETIETPDTLNASFFQYNKICPVCWDQKQIEKYYYLDK